MGVAGLAALPGRCCGCEAWAQELGMVVAALPPLARWLMSLSFVGTASLVSLAPTVLLSLLPLVPSKRHTSRAPLPPCMQP